MIDLNQRFYKGINSQSRKVAWSNAKKYNITIGSHIYYGSNGGLDFFRDRITN